MRTLIAIVAALACTYALALDDKYKPSTKQDPIYNAQTKAAAAEADRRKAEAAARKDQPLIKVPVTNSTSVQTGSVDGKPGVLIKKETP